GLLSEHRRDVAAVGLAAERLDGVRLEGNARDHRHAVVALLPIERDVLVAEPLEALARELVVGALRLLQAQDIRPRRLDELRHQVDAQPHRIDVPGGDGELHSSDLMGRHAEYKVSWRPLHQSRGYASTGAGNTGEYHVIHELARRRGLHQADAAAGRPGRN